MTATRDNKRRMNREIIRTLTAPLAEMLKEDWPKHYHEEKTLIRVWRGNMCLVMLHDIGSGAHRLSVVKAKVVGSKCTWDAEITWDELQALKNRLGFAHQYALEVYPRMADAIGTNQRHLWILENPLPIGWFHSPIRKPGEPQVVQPEAPIYGEPPVDPAAEGETQVDPELLEAGDTAGQVVVPETPAADDAAVQS